MMSFGAFLGKYISLKLSFSSSILNFSSSLKKQMKKAKMYLEPWSRERPSSELHLQIQINAWMTFSANKVDAKVNMN